MTRGRQEVHRILRLVARTDGFLPENVRQLAEASDVAVEIMHHMYLIELLFCSLGGLPPIVDPTI